MSDWNSTQYLKFENERTRPARDLAGKIKFFLPRTAVDLGCGPGNSTSVLKECFPNAIIKGIDSSPDMIEKARKTYPKLQFELCDMLDLTGKYDLLFSNACLQWMPDHKYLIPALMENLESNGVLAVQMPINSEEPLFRLIKEVASEPRWGLGGVELHPGQTLSAHEYIKILQSCSTEFDIWETKYYHILKSHEALIEWIKSARLRPYLNFLGKTKGAEFEQELLLRSKDLYKPTKNGEVVFGFKRLFFIAIK